MSCRNGHLTRRAHWTEPCAASSAPHADSAPGPPFPAEPPPPNRCALNTYETVGRLASWWRESAAVLFGCVSQGGIPTDERDRPAGRQGARQMDGVVASQGEPFGEFAGVACKVRVDRNPQELAVDRLELGERAFVRSRGEASRAQRRAKSRAALGVGEDARRRGVRARPQFVGDAGAFLGDDELDERRRVEVEDQRRCSATSSDTDPLALTFAGRLVRGPVGGVTRPRLTRSSSGSAAPTADSRAIGCPRRVTTTSAPPWTCSKCSLSRS
jgi:hypothetical protein